MMMAKPRPKHLDLLRIRLPLPGWVSILHRASGAGLFLLLPLGLYLLDNSLHSRSSFNNFMQLIAQPWMKLILLGAIWAFLHHLFAGLRYLAMDFHWGVELPAARTTSMWVLGISLALTILCGIKLW
jgi:succinate dehydrogenase / fumarate reductase cytochrome b subunit